MLYSVTVCYRYYQSFIICACSPCMACSGTVHILRGSTVSTKRLELSLWSHVTSRCTKMPPKQKYQVIYIRLDVYLYSRSNECTTLNPHNDSIWQFSHLHDVKHLICLHIYIYIAVCIACAAVLQTYNDVYGMPRYKIRITALGLLAP